MDTITDGPARCTSCGTARPTSDHRPDGYACLTLQAEREQVSA
jgi:hypothetical protein